MTKGGGRLVKGGLVFKGVCCCFFLVVLLPPKKKRWDEKNESWEKSHTLVVEKIWVCLFFGGAVGWIFRLET